MKWLPETKKRPIRPDLPWLRNLSWVKIHALQIGFGLALIVYWGQLLGRSGAVFGLAVTVAQIMLGVKQKKGNMTKCDHGIGIHDIRKKPWYAISASVVTWVALALGYGLP